MRAEIEPAAQRRPLLFHDQRGGTIEKIMVVALFVFGAAFGVRQLGRSTKNAIQCQAGEIAVVSTAGNATCRPAAESTPLCNGLTCMCFVAGTPVVTSAGPQAIETIQPGTLVLARDQFGAAMDWKPVLRAFVNQTHALVRLTVALPDGTRDRLEVTPNHPLFAEGRGWVAAGDLVPGEDWLVDQRSQRVSLLVADAGAAEVPVYNLDVADYHTYFAGRLGVWAHNVAGAPCSNQGVGSDIDLPSANDDLPTAVAGGGPSTSASTGAGAGGAAPNRPPPPLPHSPSWLGPSNPPFGSAGDPNYPALSGHQPPNVGSVNPEQIVASLDAAFTKGNYDWSKHHEIVDHLPDYAGKPAFIAYRYYGNLTVDVAEAIVHNGSISGDGRIHGTPADPAVSDFDHQFPNPTALADAVNDHKNNGHGSSHFVSTSTDPKYAYGAFDNRPNASPTKVGLVIVTTQTGEKIYQSAALRPFTSHGHMQGTNAQGHDYEGEHVYGGAILPQSIIYGAYVPMGIGTFPPGSRPPMSPFGAGGLFKPGLKPSSLKPPKPPPN
ncbi:MAG: large repetitive protein [Myxococcales bacterium]|nr:large repetitive protein [Myxococcales bacterium]